MPDQSQKKRTPAPIGPGGGGEGPAAPKVDKPNVDDLLKRMRKVDPDQARGLVPFAVKLEGDLVKRIHALAQERGVPVNDLVADLLRRGLDAK